MTEDETYPYGGYAKAPAAALIEGDGVRFGVDGGDRCWLVVASAEGPTGETTMLTLADRSQHVAAVFADALNRPLNGMADDNGLHVRELTATETVWIRL